MKVDLVDRPENDAAYRATSEAPVPAIVVTRVSKQFKSHQVLSQVNLVCESGESVALIGLNGAGKTTLLRSMLGFVGVDEGQIQLFGLNAERPVARKKVAFLPERLLLTPELSGWQSIELLLGIRQLVADRDRCEQELSAMGFPVEQLDAPSKTYSKGMSQKIGLVAAINSNAQLLILDEPFTGLDPRARRSLMSALNQWRSVGRSILFTAHSLSDLDQLSDKLAIMHNGRLVFYGSSESLREQFAASGATDDLLEQAFLNCIEQSDEAEFA